MKLIFSIVSALRVAVLMAPAFAGAKTPQHNSAAGHAHPHHSGARSKAVAGLRRDGHGNIKRSTRAKDDFRKYQPCPVTGKTAGSCPGYIIDHVKPLKRGGAVSPGNMQWQTKKAAKLKDKTE